MTYPIISIKATRGSPLPYGPNFFGNAVNFSIFSKNATSVVLALWKTNDKEPFATFNLDPIINRTGDLWHIMLNPILPGIEYAYFVDGPYEPIIGHLFDKKKPLIDPYSQLLSNGVEFGKKEDIIRSVLLDKKPFDWQGDRHPKIPLEQMIIYEMHTRGFTIHPSSNVNNKGKFLGIIEKIPYLKSLGINAIELMPIHAFNECEYYKVHPKTKEPLFNYWGYSTINFFAPQNRYATDKLKAIDEFKLMVRELHKEGIEVILDVVFNHTSEGNEQGPIHSYKGIENSVYYMLGPEGQYLNFSGCGNTLNCNHPVVRDLIRASIRYWVSEMHVDGFRFDLASILGRGKDGEPLSSPPLLEMLAQDPLLGSTKLIAEAWDAGGLYQVGSFPSWGVWAEWNGKFRDDCRAFIKGSDNKAGYFATRICGSPDLYANSRSPGHSINFITAHDGFTLRDLVSYNKKHNEDNAEDNRDGCNDNQSWNCGYEGDCDDKSIIRLRKRQMKNFFVALMVSQGAPMIMMGDELGFSKEGNNNTWCQDNSLNWMNWEKKDEYSDFFHFSSAMIRFRKLNRILRQGHYLSGSEISWHGHIPFTPNWEPKSRFIAFTLHDLINKEDIYIAFNTDMNEAHITIPPEKTRKKWHLVLDTNDENVINFSDPKNHSPLKKSSYVMKPYSSLILKQL
jgi:isoamylase/glycogen operon protein